MTVTVPEGTIWKRGKLTMTPEQGRMMIGLITRELGSGRPPKIEPCRYCGVDMATRERRAHEATCPQRGAK